MSEELRKEIDSMKLKEVCTTAVNLIGGVSDRAINVGILYQLTLLNRNITQLLEMEKSVDEPVKEIQTKSTETPKKVAETKK